MVFPYNPNSFEFFPILVFFSIALALAIFIVLVSQILGKKIYNEDKLKSYECGFDAFSDARGKFEVKFYLVAILFVIFDLEIIFLIPWALNLKHISNLGFFSMMFFLFILTLGFIYEWKKGALDW
ncbi:MAG: NADH-quinone oxidoreductase subunit A [Rickettsia sp.]|nr:NADH-quinone oxidoreductase subunit A [Rickettsia sp.]